MTLRWWMFGVGVATATIGVGWWALDPPELAQEEPNLATSVSPDVVIPIEETPVVIQRGDNITSVLGSQDVGPSRARLVVEAARPITNLIKIRAGDTLYFRRQQGEEAALVMPLDAWNERMLVVTLGEEPVASVEERELVRTPVTAAGEVHATLWETGVSMGLHPLNLVDLAKIFAWDIDFNTEIRRGDRFRLVVEQVKDAESGRLIRYGAILAAEYQQSNGKSHEAYRYVGADGIEGFFDANGDSSKTPFLKSPIEFSRVSSRFGRRYHPILKRWRAHRGTDYAASSGTPIRSIGDGLISFVGTKGGYGRHVRVEHDGEHASSYSHLSRYQVKRGQRVSQGDVIGRVGSTGLATGPHLHFEFYENGKQVDYGTLEFDRTEPISEEERPGFEKALKTLEPLLVGTIFPSGTCEEPLPRPE